MGVVLGHQRIKAYARFVWSLGQKVSMKGRKRIERLWEEARELSLGNTAEVDRLNSPPTPLQFLRDYISPNKPCIISNSTLHWSALSNWSTDSYLSKSLSHSLVSVHLTPDGHADALVPHPSSANDDPSPPSQQNQRLCFASAHVEQMPFPQALRLISSSNDDNNSPAVAYAQQQNDCFRSEYSELASDCDPHIPWATEALGCLPEAVNLWIGNHLSQTSFHKDHYENLYAVVSGEKHFLLLPPTDVHRMYIRPYPAAHYSYSQESGEFGLELENPVRYVPWCSVNPYPSPQTKDREMSEFPLYFNGPKPFECTIKAGEILYLPSMWFHHVRQSPDSQGRTIAINYWYDMQFDMKYAYFNLLKSIRIHDQSFLETEHNDSPSDVSESNIEDQYCSDASVVSVGEDKKHSKND